MGTVRFPLPFMSHINQRGGQSTFFKVEKITIIVSKMKGTRRELDHTPF